jgi:predicted nucleotide-binding protein (sugar kinase/HSP70/actin superfamily)
MKSIVFFLLMVLTFPVFAQELVRLGLDDLQSVSPKIESDSVIKVEGQSSVKITVQWPVTICLGEIEDLKVENARLIYKARVKTELDGLAYLEMWAHLGDKNN